MRIMNGHFITINYDNLIIVESVEPITNYPFWSVGYGVVWEKDNIHCWSSESHPHAFPASPFLVPLNWDIA